MTEDYIALDGAGLGSANHLKIYPQHSGDPSQTTGIMIMEEGNILLQVDAEGVGKFILELSARWQGEKPQGLP